MTPLGTKGVGELAITGMAAAIANTVYHATGTRVRSLPISIEKVLGHKSREIVDSNSSLLHD
jgi:xanthine dehydrogenase YagR molybdenum-binding subunit